MDKLLEQAEQIRNRMRHVRTALDTDVDRVRGGARQLADWRSYVRAYPWTCVAAAAAVGFFAIPRRLEIISPDPQTIEKLAKKQRLVVEPAPKNAAQKSGFSGSLLSLLGNIAVRSAITMAGQQLGAFLGQDSEELPKNPQERGRHERPHHNPSR